MTLHPAALRAGDRVAVISPAGPVRDSAALDEGMKRLARFGLRPQLGKSALASLGFLAGDDEARAADVRDALADPSVRGIFCARGGYGVTRILDRLDLSPLAADPRPVVGSSDATALLAAAFRRHGVVGFHGPMLLGAPMDAETEELQRALLFEARTAPPLPADRAGPPPRVINPGIAEGPLVGGNLSILAALQGTPHAPRTRGAIVFIEDVNEAPYRVDRMLTQLHQGGFFDGVAGVVAGDFARATPPPGTAATDLDWVLNDRLTLVSAPAASGFPFGHRPRSWTLPVGVPARLDARDPAGTPVLTLLEPAVRERT